jgi:hypothetical protein
MTKTDHTLNLGNATLEDHSPLTESELDVVSGGWSLSGIQGAGTATMGHRALTHAVNGFFKNGGTRA